MLVINGCGQRNIPMMWMKKSINGKNIAFFYRDKRLTVVKNDYKTVNINNIYRGARILRPCFDEKKPFSISRGRRALMGLFFFVPEQVLRVVVRDGVAVFAAVIGQDVAFFREFVARAAVKDFDFDRVDAVVGGQVVAHA